MSRTHMSAEKHEGATETWSPISEVQKVLEGLTDNPDGPEEWVLILHDKTEHRFRSVVDMVPFLVQPDTLERIRQRPATLIREVRQE